MEAPICHLTYEISQDGNHFSYSCEGAEYLSLSFNNPGKVTYKVGSDADVLADPPIQQLVFETENDCEVTISLFPKDGILLKPERAQTGQAILSQAGKPLIYGVNGLYDLDSDMYTIWDGIEWRFEGEAVVRQGGRDFICLKGRVKKDISSCLWFSSITTESTWGMNSMIRENGVTTGVSFAVGAPVRRSKTR